MGGCFRVYPCNCMTQAVCHPPTRIQCPAIVAFVVTFLGAILSFTCIPVTTKDASVQSAHQGKPPPCPHGQWIYHFALEVSTLYLYWEWEDLPAKGFGGQRGDKVSYLLLAADSL